MAAERPDRGRTRSRDTHNHGAFSTQVEMEEEGVNCVIIVCHVEVSGYDTGVRSPGDRR